MIIDFHTHLFPKEIREHRENFFEKEPSFKLLYEPPKSKLVSSEELIETMNEQGVDKSVIFGFPWKKTETFKKNNDYIIESVKKYPDRLIGFGCFDLDSKDSPKEAQRCIDNGLKGIGELAFYQSGIDEEGLKKIAPIMEICLKNDLPVMIHTNEPIGHNYPGKTPITPKQIYDLVLKFPENKIVLAHWGGGIFFYNLMKRDVKDALKNVYYDTAASPYLYDVDIYKNAINLGCLDKILLGTDFPLLKPARYFKELEKSGISQSEIDDICGNNGGRLLKLI